MRRTILLIPHLLLLVACTSGGGGQTGSQQAVTPVTLSYPDGRIMATGSYLSGTTTRTGEWSEYFDAEGSPQQWRRHYEAGVWDEARDWREWNADGSIRNDADDR